MKIHKLDIPEGAYRECRAKFEKTVHLHVNHIYLISYLMMKSKRKALNFTLLVFQKAYNFYPMLDESINEEEWLVRIWKNIYFELYPDARNLDLDHQIINDKILGEIDPGLEVEKLSAEEILKIFYDLSESSRLQLIQHGRQKKNYGKTPISSRIINEIYKVLFEKISDIEAPKRLTNKILEKTINKIK